MRAVGVAVVVGANYSRTLLIRIATFAHFNVFLMSHRPAVACPPSLSASVCLSVLYLISISPAVSLSLCLCVCGALRCLELTLYAKIINH